MARGLGLSDEFSINLEIKITESNIPSRDDLVLFSGGTERGTAQASSSSYKELQVGQEKFLIILEVHNGLTGLIVENVSVQKDGQKIEFDGMWGFLRTRGR